jgi:hypothetical protein
MNTHNVEEIYLPHAYFIKLGGFNAPTFTVLCKQHGISPTDEGYPVFTVLKALRARAYQKGRNSTDDADNLERELKKEKIIGERIKNQKQLRMLIPIEEAKERIRTTFLAVANMLRYAIKKSSPQVALCSSVRDCENILIEAYNSAIKKLKADSKIQTWEEMGANTELRGIELSDNSAQDISTGGSEEDSDSLEGECTW